MTAPATILAPIDFSSSSQMALQWASMMARSMHARLLIVHVEPGQPTTNLGPSYYGLADPGIADLAMQLGTAKPTEPEVEYEHRMLVGDPSTEILKLAASEPVSLIVLGSHGRVGVRALLMGSVAEKVLRKAACAVVVCRPAVTADQGESPLATP